jgi:glucan phosphoethanolaminetransferase (alkaline phosphatase superfamily)
MKNKLNRREFLKLSGLASFSLAASHFTARPGSNQSSNGKQNVLIVLFDALSAYNMSLYGYPRDTTPNLNRLAENATVYHNHFAAGNYTTPGTASLLTGTLPWTHRAVVHNDIVAKEYVKKNIFSEFPQ